MQFRGPSENGLKADEAAGLGDSQREGRKIDGSLKCKRE